MRLFATPSRPATLLTALLLTALGATLASPCLAQKSGTHERTLEANDRTREFLLHIPRNYKKEVRQAVMKLQVTPKTDRRRPSSV
mgnify:CR=1 FL=1